MSDPTAVNAQDEARCGSRILVVDDEMPIRIVAQRMLERLGHQVVLATNPTEAVQLVFNASAPFDLALVDVNLAGESGLVLAAELQRVVGEMPIVIMGGDLDRGMLGGSVRQLLPKPFAYADLGAAVASVIPTPSKGESANGDTCLSGPDAAKLTP